MVRVVYRGGSNVAVIIGNSTRVNIGFNGGGSATEGIVSVEWNSGSQPNRLYTLGMGSVACGVKEFATIRSAQVTVSFSIYGGITGAISTCASEVCANSPASAVVSIVPGVCGNASVPSFNHTVFINNYSYNKDRNTFGQEQYSCNAYISSSVQTVGTCNEYTEPEPTYVTLGIAEGTLEGDGSQGELESITGAKFRDDACIATTSRGSIQASQMSIGEAGTTYHGTFKSIGGSTGWAPGKIAKASVTLNLQPIYLGT
jgi:hypothetical protein